VKSTVRSLKQSTGKSLQRSGSGAALPSTETDKNSSNNKDLELKILCIVLESVFYEMMSGDKLYLAFLKAKQEIDKMRNPRADELFNKLVLLADNRHKKNPLYGAFGV